MTKAYLHLIVVADKLGSPIKDASIREEPIPTSWVITPGPGERLMMPLVTEGETFQEAKDLMVRMILGKEPCPIGDLRYLIPFVDPDLAQGLRNEHGHAVHHAILRLPKYDFPVFAPDWARQ